MHVRTVVLGTNVDSVVGLLEQSGHLEDVLLADEVVVPAGGPVEPERCAVKSLHNAPRFSDPATYHMGWRKIG